MPIRNLADLPSFLSRGQTLMGVDYGTKFIGLAVCDPGFSLASALATVERGKFPQVVADLRKHMESRNVGALVIGLPLQMDGKTGPMAQAVRTFARNLENDFNPEMAFCDERFSTAVIQRQLTEVADMSRAKRAAVVDKLAAAYMLQGAIDFLRNRS